MRYRSKDKIFYNDVNWGFDKIIMSEMWIFIMLISLKVLGNNILKKKEFT